MTESVLERTMRAGEKVADSVCDIKAAKAAMSAALDDGIEAARAAMLRGRATAEHLAEDAARGVRRYPLQTVAVAAGVALGLGVLLGVLVTRK
jgi:ElaB/YqjD/DUF883 family membrane-anchored ribosome-binding protein